MPVDVLVPPVGTTVDTLTLVSWYKQEGETVVKDEPLYVVQTDKATLDIEAPASGILCRISAEPGADVVALTRIASIRQADEVVDLIDDSPKAHIEPRQLAVEAPKTPKLPERVDSRIFISPRAKKLAETNGIDWRVLKGTGPEGAIVTRDIPLPTDPPVIQMFPSSPFAILTAYADAGELVAFRSRIQSSGLAISYDALYVQILGRVLTEYPQVNGIPGQHEVHIGLNSYTDDGLVSPVVHDVAGKKLSEIESEIKLDLAGEAPTFRLMNLDAFGLATFSSELHPCGGALLSVSQIRKNMVWLSLTYNIYKASPETAMRFLQRVVEYIEEPHLLLI